MADRGRDVLAFGPMKPVGLTDPRTGRRPHAVVQLRAENRHRTAYNLVGFQTRLAYPEQQRIFRMIPGLGQAEFLRFGSIHRNSYLDSPRLLGPELELRARPQVHLAGQITGVEGYIESTAMGLVAARFVRRAPAGPPGAAAARRVGHGRALPARHPRRALPNEPFEPMNINFGLMPPLAGGRRSATAAGSTPRARWTHSPAGAAWQTEPVRQRTTGRCRCSAVWCASVLPAWPAWWRRWRSGAPDRTPPSDPAVLAHDSGAGGGAGDARIDRAPDTLIVSDAGSDGDDRFRRDADPLDLSPPPDAAPDVPPSPDLAPDVIPPPPDLPPDLPPDIAPVVNLDLNLRAALGVRRRWAAPASPTARAATPAPCRTGAMFVASGIPNAGAAELRRPLPGRRRSHDHRPPELPHPAVDAGPSLCGSSRRCCTHTAHADHPRPSPPATNRWGSRSAPTSAGPAIWRWGTPSGESFRPSPTRDLTSGWHHMRLHLRRHDPPRCSSTAYPSAGDLHRQRHRRDRRPLASSAATTPLSWATRCTSACWTTCASTTRVLTPAEIARLAQGRVGIRSHRKGELD